MDNIHVQYYIGIIVGDEVSNKGSSLENLLFPSFKEASTFSVFIKKVCRPVCSNLRIIFLDYSIGHSFSFKILSSALVFSTTYYVADFRKPWLRFHCYDEHHDQDSLRRQGFISPHSLQSVNEGSQGKKISQDRDAQAGTETDCRNAAYFPVCFLTPSRTPCPEMAPPAVDSIPSQLSSVKEMPCRRVCRPFCWRHFHSGAPSSQIILSCVVDKNPTGTHYA